MTQLTPANARVGMRVRMTDRSVQGIPELRLAGIEGEIKDCTDKHVVYVRLDNGDVATWCYERFDIIDPAPEDKDAELTALRARDIGWKLQCEEQEEEIARLTAELARARELLTPLADAARFYAHRPDEYRAHIEYKVKELRAMKSYLADNGKEGDASAPAHSGRSSSTSDTPPPVSQPGAQPRETLTAMTAIERLGATEDYTDAYRRGQAVGRSQAVNELAEWMIQNSYATGHGDNLSSLLSELRWQIEDRIARRMEDENG